MVAETTTVIVENECELDLDFHEHATNHVTHGLHSFAAKCPPPLAAWIIERWSKQGDYVLDPMAGSGTTLVEAQLLGRQALAAEIDPLARLLCEVKTTVLPAPTLARWSASLLQTVDELCGRYDRGERGHVPPLPEFHQRDRWFLPEVSAKLALIRAAIGALQVPVEYRRFYYLALSSLIIARTSVANARDVVHSRHHYREHTQPPDVATLFARRVARMSKQMAEYEARLANGGYQAGVRVVGHDARQLPIEDGSMHLVATSPPYCNALDYTRAHNLAVGWLADVLGINVGDYRQLGQHYIGSERAPRTVITQGAEAALDVPLVRDVVTSVTALDAKRGAIVRRYFGDMWKVLHEIGRVLQPDGHAALVVCPSNIRKIPIPTHQVFERMALALELPSRARFERVFLRERTINDRRRLMPYIGMEERMRTEYILVLKKTR